MATTGTERLAEAQFDRETSDRDALRERISLRTVVLVLLGVVFLLVLTAVLATIRISYHPRRGC